MTPSIPRLWHFRISHFNEKVRWALDYKGWPHVRQSLVPGFHVPKARGLTGQNQLPILELEGRTLVDSSAILAELERLRPEPALFPEDPVERQRALDLEDYFDEVVAPDVRRLFWWAYANDSRACARMATDGSNKANYYAMRLLWPALRPVLHINVGLQKGRVRHATGALRGYFDRIERELQPSGYLVGDQFTVADLCVASIMTGVIRPAQFSYALPEPWPERLVALRESVADHPGFQWVADIYERHRGASCEVEPT